MELLHGCTHAAEIVGIGYPRHIVVSFQVDVRRMVYIRCFDNARNGIKRVDDRWCILHYTAIGIVARITDHIKMTLIAPKRLSY